MGASDIDAGGAKVRIGADVNPFNDGLDRAEARLRAFATAALAIGAQIAGFGLSLGAGLVAAGGSFASTGTKLNDLNKQLAGMEAGTPEFAKLSKEATRLAAIMGGESVSAAVKLGESFQGIKDAVSSVVIKFSAALAPAITSVVDYFTKAINSIGDFIQRNRALAPQAAIISGALVATGAAIAALGAAFYIAGPVIRLAMIGASAATLAFSVATSAANVVVGIVTAALTAAAVAYRVIAFTIGVAAVAVKILSLAFAATTLIMGLSAAGYSTVSASLGLLFLASKLNTVGQLVLAAAVLVMTSSTTAASLAVTGLGIAMAIVANPITTLIVAIAAVVAVTGLVTYAFLKLTGLGNVIGRVLSSAFELLKNAAMACFSAIVTGGKWLIGFFTGPIVDAFAMLAGTGIFDGVGTQFQNLRDTITGAFRGVVDAAIGLPGRIIGGFSDISASARQFFGDVVAMAKTALDSSVKLFQDLFQTAKGTFKGISDAISAGNIQLAINVLWAGIQVAWLKGAAGLGNIWSSALLDLQGMFDGFIAYIHKGYAELLGEAQKTLISLDPTTSDKTKEMGTRLVNNAVFSAKSAIDQGVANRDAERAKKKGEIANSGPSTDLVQAEVTLAELMGQAAMAAQEYLLSQNKIADGKDGTEKAKEVGASMQTAAAQVYNSAGAASTIAKAYNNQQGTVQDKQLDAAKALLKEAQKTNALLAKQKPTVTVTERT
jgi:hypothetical protein